MNVQIETRGQITVLHLKGELDSTHCIRERPGVPDVTESGARVVLDLADVPYINSAGISELVQLAAAANTRGAHLVLAQPSAFVEQVLETTHLDRFFELAPTLDEAVQKLS